MMMTSNHPLPEPPGPPQRPGMPKQRQKSSFSFRSNHSRKSSGSGVKIDLHETHAEKQSRRLTTKADPSMAITEAEPSAVASSVRTSLAPIRAIQHRDNQGIPIADPDRSNPTRSRWERPLDTIRSFEAAIDGSYSRKSFPRTESADSVANHQRRSYYAGNADERPRYSQNGYYGGRPQSYRPDSTYMDGRSNVTMRPDNHYTYGENYGPSNGYYPNRARYGRTASEPHFNNGQGVYPVPGNQQSYETVTTASGSGSSGDPAGYSTDPSSENSSLDRIAPLPSKEPMNGYGSNGYGNGNQYGPGPNGPQQLGNGYGPPPPPRKDSSGPRVPIKLGASNEEPQRPSAGEKRKSWLGRRFSRQ